MADDSIVKKVLHGLGLSGSSVGINSLLNPARTPAGAEKSFQDFRDAGKVADPDIWARYNSLVSGNASYQQCLTVWDEMAGWDLVAAALVEIVDEALQTTQEDPAVMWYECSDSEVEKELNQMLEGVLEPGTLESQVWHTAALGNSFDRINYSPGDGVTGFTYVHPTEMRRYWLERTRRCIGFRWEGHMPDKSDLEGTQLAGTDRVKIDFGGANRIEELWYPWDFFHIRRMYRSRGNEHGEALFGEAHGIYKKLRMGLDQMVVHRAQIQPDRYIVNIDTQDQVPTEQMRTVQRWRQLFRKKVAFGDGSGANGQPTDFKSFYNPLALDTVLWMAQPKGFQHSIEKIPGTASVPDVYDIEMLSGLFFCILGMPKQWITGAQGGSGENGGNPMSGKALLAQDIRFLRRIKAIRSPIKEAYKWLAYFHLILKKKRIDDVTIRVMMSNISSLEEQTRMETFKAQADLIAQLGEIMNIYKLPREEWIEVVFKKYMHLPDHVIDTFTTALPVEMDVQEARKHKKDAPRMAILTRMMEKELEKNGYNPRRVRESLQALAAGDHHFPKLYENKPLRLKDYVIDNMNPGDLLQSGFGNVERVYGGKSGTLPPSGARPLNESSTEKPAYRQFGPLAD